MQIDVPGITIGDGRFSFSVKNMETGEVRELPEEHYNRITDFGLREMAISNSGCAMLYNCMICADYIDEAVDFTGGFIANLDDPKTPYRASYRNGNTPSSVFVDTGTEAYFELTKIWTIRQGRAFTVKAILAGAMKDGESGMGGWRTAQDAFVGSDPESHTSWHYPYKAGFWTWSQTNIKDKDGNLSSFSIDAIEQLTITYKWRIYVPRYAPATVIKKNIEGVDTTITVTPKRDVYWTVLTPADHPNTTPVSGTQYYLLYQTQKLGWIDSEFYSNSDFTNKVGAYSDRDYASVYDTNKVSTLQGKNTIFFDLNKGNPGIGSFLFPTKTYLYTVTIDPPIKKDNTKKLWINLILSWGRKT